MCVSKKGHQKLFSLQPQAVTSDAATKEEDVTSPDALAPTKATSEESPRWSDTDSVDETSNDRQGVNFTSNWPETNEEEDLPNRPHGPGVDDDWWNFPLNGSNDIANPPIHVDPGLGMQHDLEENDIFKTTKGSNVIFTKYHKE
jgi:hypothetical protein